MHPSDSALHGNPSVQMAFHKLRWFWTVFDFTWLQQLIKLVDFLLILTKYSWVLTVSIFTGVISNFSAMHASQKRPANKFPLEWLSNRKTFQQKYSIFH